MKQLTGLDATFLYMETPTTFGHVSGLMISDLWTNRVSGLVADLPTNCDDPLERVARCREAMAAAKKQFELVPAEALIDLTQYSSPVLFTAAVRLASQLKLADRVNMPANLVISNVPGPRHALYLAGATLLHYYPVSTITEGQGLNITVQSYRDCLDFGLVGCRELMRDLDDLADLLVDEIGVLAKAAAG